MKTTIDLPPEIVRDLKLHTVHHGRKMAQIAVETILRGLTVAKSSENCNVRHRVTLPLIQCLHPATPATTLTADKVAEILLKQEVDWLP